MYGMHTEENYKTKVYKNLGEKKPLKLGRVIYRKRNNRYSNLSAVMDAWPDGFTVCIGRLK